MNHAQVDLATVDIQAAKIRRNLLGSCAGDDEVEGGARRDRKDNARASKQKTERVFIRDLLIWTPINHTGYKDFFRDDTSDFIRGRLLDQRYCWYAGNGCCGNGCSCCDCGC